MNENDNININPAQDTITNTYTAFSILRVDVVPNISANITFKLLGANNNILKIDNLVLVGSDYNNWGSDDDYLVNIICQKKGFTKA